ncbi:hypothetical protein BPO_1500 [Bergeyella porcorum]|uniref:Uncharacterized protein n=1 Tax=Bergeyella porcorum TaxID=1735111 RepID=A0AAU0F0B8_9FLAO
MCCKAALITTFYVIAVYFGSVAIKNTRYTVGQCSWADLVGVHHFILSGPYLFFG